MILDFIRTPTPVQINASNWCRREYVSRRLTAVNKARHLPTRWWQQQLEFARSLTPAISLPRTANFKPPPHININKPSLLRVWVRRQKKGKTAEPFHPICEAHYDSSHSVKEHSETSERSSRRTVRGSASGPSSSRRVNKATFDRIKICGVGSYSSQPTRSCSQHTDLLMLLSS